MLAGRLTGTLDGRPVVISAADQTLVIQLSGLRSAWALRPHAACALRAIGPGLARLKGLGIRVAVQIGRDWPSLELFPNPSFLTSLIVPALKLAR